MANEIEFKIKLSKEKFFEFFDSGRDHLNIRNDGSYMKLDEYYEAGSKEKNEVIRIRGEYKFNSVDEFLGRTVLKNANDIVGEYFLCYKEKNIINGSEISSEYETKIDDPNVFRKIMASKNIPMYFTKRKRAMKIVFRDEDENLSKKYNIEFVIVNDNYYYIEIEWVSDFTETCNNSDKVIEFLEDKIKALGFDPSIKDPRYWRTIITED